MRTTLPDLAVDLGRAVDTALRDAGGVDLARAAERNPNAAERAAAVFAGIGIHDVDPRAGLAEATAAAELCRVAGSFVAPYPVVGVLLRTGDTPFALVDPGFPLIDHAHVAPLWTAAAVSGELFDAEPAEPTGSNLAPFARTVRLRPRPDAESSTMEVQLALVLGAWQLLGIGQRALELAIGHTRARVQFGRPLSDFQVIRHGIAEESVGLEGLDLLCRFALWRVCTEPSSALPDALAARWEAQRVVQRTLRAAQQYHGAAGLADEYDVSVLVRHAQVSLRTPESAAATLGSLRAAIERDGFAGPFAPGGDASTPP